MSQNRLHSGPSAAVFTQGQNDHAMFTSTYRAISLFLLSMKRFQLSVGLAPCHELKVSVREHRRRARASRYHCVDSSERGSAR